MISRRLWRIKVDLGLRHWRLPLKCSRGGRLSQTSADFSAGTLILSLLEDQTSRGQGTTRIERPSSAPIDKALEGTWDGVLDLEGKPMRVVLTMTNHADGTSTATLAIDSGAVEIPVSKITQQGGTVWHARTLAQVPATSCKAAGARPILPSVPSVAPLRGDAAWLGPGCVKSAFALLPFRRKTRN